MFDLSCFIGTSYFDDDESQTYSKGQQVCNFFKDFGSTANIILW